MQNCASVVTTNYQYQLQEFILPKIQWFEKSKLNRLQTSNPQKIKRLQTQKIKYIEIRRLQNSKYKQEIKSCEKFKRLTMSNYRNS